RSLTASSVCASQRSTTVPKANAPVSAQAESRYPDGKRWVNTPTSRTAKTTPPRRTRATHVSISRRRTTSGIAGIHPSDRPLGVFTQHVVVVLEVGLDGRALLGAADVAGRDERVALEPASVVARHVQTVVTLSQLGGIGPQPLH